MLHPTRTPFPMSDLYQRQRTSLILLNHHLSWIPEEPTRPDAPASLASEAAWRRWLRPALGTHAACVLIIGWGDGTAFRRIVADPVGRTKTIYQLVFAGEEPAVAAALCEPLLESLAGVSFSLGRLRHAGDVASYATTAFGAHRDITRLAGIDLVDGHPLTAEAEALREALRPALITAGIDRPQAYGNDIIDSWQGLSNAAGNARILLNSPSIHEMSGFFGKRPVISIAAGPSVKRHLDALRRLQDRCILVACDAVFHGLIDAGIQPHVVTPLERVDMVRPLVARAAESPRTLYGGLPVVLPDVVERFAGRAICVNAGDALYEWLDPDCGLRINSGLSTGVLSVSVACALGSGPVWLVGHDLSRTASETHWDGAGFAKSEFAKCLVGGESGFDTRWLPGHGGGMVESCAWWDRFRDGIVYEVKRMAMQGRTVFNVNAHDGVCARIDGCEAAPLPDPDRLDPLPPIELPRPAEGRYARWAERARQLPEDCKRLDAHLRTVRDGLRERRRSSASQWNPVEAVAGLGWEQAGISPGNRMAFAYFLRSAIHNVNADMHWRRRTPTAAHANWRMLGAIDQAAQALINALGKLASAMEAIRRGL